MHALIIEDEPLIALLIEDRLRRLGYDSVDFAGTQAAALAAARRRRPDLITSDVRLAQGCGIDAVEAICGRRRIAVLFITATAIDVRNRIPGAHVIEKPFALAELDTILAAVSEPARTKPSPSQPQRT